MLGTPNVRIAAVIVPRGVPVLSHELGARARSIVCQEGALVLYQEPIRVPAEKIAQLEGALVLKLGLKEALVLKLALRGALVLKLGLKEALVLKLGLKGTLVIKYGLNGALVLKHGLTRAQAVKIAQLEGAPVPKRGASVLKP